MDRAQSQQNPRQQQEQEQCCEVQHFKYPAFPLYSAMRLWSLIYKISYDYDNAKVTIDLQRSSNILRRTQGFS